LSEKKPPEKTRRVRVVPVVQPSSKLDVDALRAKLLSEARTAINLVARGYAHYPELAVLIERLKRAVQDVE
jgi:hypothetical protein